MIDLKGLTKLRRREKSKEKLGKRLESSGQSWNRKEKNAPENADTVTLNLILTKLGY